MQYYETTDKFFKGQHKNVECFVAEMKRHYVEMSIGITVKKKYSLKQDLFSRNWHFMMKTLFKPYLPTALYHIQ